MSETKASDFIALTWRAIPSLRGLDSKMAVKDPETCNARVVTVGDRPVLIATDIPLVLAQHIVSLHNNSLAAKAA